MKMTRLVVVVMLCGVVNYQFGQVPQRSVPVSMDVHSNPVEDGVQPAPKKSTTLTVPQPNKFYALKPYHDAKEIEITEDDPIFYILVHGTFSSETDSKDPEMLYWGEDEFIEKVPKDFFGPNSNPEKEPIRFAFRWSGNLSDDARLKGGKKLAASIEELYASFPNARIICLGHSHGGNIINVASQYLKPTSTLQYVIQLATPVLAYNILRGTFDNLTGYYPNAQAIDTLMIFYSEHDFIQPGGAVISSFKRRYAPIAGIDLYNVRLRKLRGSDDLHIHMHDDVIGGKILQLCQKIKQTYRYNKNLIADITPAARRTKLIDALNPAERNTLFAGLNIDKVVNRPLISIRPYTGDQAPSGKFMKTKPTDSFWPNWTGKYPEEDRVSAEDAGIFYAIFGFPMDERLSAKERVTQAADVMRKEAQSYIKTTQQDIKEKAAKAAETMREKAEKGVMATKKSFESVQQNIKSWFK